ncbi:MAG TPA: hypothetical protein PLH19_01770 [Anaerolineae bacterium]|nr:hypothetical protein [Anaerolineae bacterium]HQH37249.1 hypothetical protein [Anaerolineae bacterium]
MKKDYTAYFARRMLDRALPYDVSVINVNVPDTAMPETSWRLTRLSRQRYFLPLSPDRKNGRLTYTVLLDNSPVPLKLGVVGAESMQRHSDILRFQEGQRSQHPAPEATVATAPPEMVDRAGEQLAILVDLTPQFGHRSREIRALAASTYWASSGSIVARLRRALAEANRYLIRANAEATPGSKCTGSITCVVFSGEEVFFGQIGAAYAFVYHPDHTVESFPLRNRLLIPLGGSLPPSIHIGYTTVEEGSTVLLATTPAVESQARERWQEILAPPDPEEIADSITQAMAGSQASGSFIIIRLSPEPPSQPPVQPRQKVQFFRQPAVAVTASPASQPSPGVVSPVPPSPTSAPSIAPGAAPQGERQTTLLPATLERRGERQAKVAGKAQDNVASPSFTPPQIKLPPVREWLKHLVPRRSAERYRERKTTAERARVRRALRTLLPGKVKGVKAHSMPLAPTEKSTVMGGLALGLLLVALFVTVTVYFESGGQARAEEYIVEARALREAAFNSQSPEDWNRLLELSSHIITLERQNTEAAAMKAEAQNALDALHSAAVLDARLQLDLGIAPAPRRLLVAGSWIYILNTTADEVIGLPLQADGLTLTTDVPTPILKRGQSFYGEVVNHLVDLAWVEPGGSYPDGAAFIYSDGGIIYIYEPPLGPGSITRQRLQGNLGPGMVTIMGTFGEKLYLVHRQDNQILTYEPVNGIYDAARGYFAAGVAPHLSEVLDMGIDGRLYLLMGDGTINAYFVGVEDPSFKLSNLPDSQAKPLVLVVESDVDKGLIYLGDPQRERILVLDKRGNFTHQFRLPGEALTQLEALAVSENPHVLYMIVANQLYIAPIPDFVTH